MRFREARKKAGLSVPEVCKAMGITCTAVYLWETGKKFPKAARLPALAKLYGCTIDELIREGDDGDWADDKTDR